MLTSNYWRLLWIRIATFHLAETFAKMHRITNWLLDKTKKSAEFDRSRINSIGRALD